MKPKIQGDFSWVGNEVLFSPTTLAICHKVFVTIGTGALDLTGKHLVHTFHRSFETQSEHVMYLGTGGSEKGNLVLASTTGQTKCGGRRQRSGNGLLAIV